MVAVLPTINLKQLLLNAVLTTEIILIAQISTLGSAQEGYLTPPPAGNSLKIKSTTVNGVTTYKCVDRIWRFVDASADLVDVANSSLVLGSYSFQYNQSDLGAAGTWTLYNSPGDISESGQSFSKVTVVRDTSILPTLLARASSHQFDGTASRISYIQQIPISSSAPVLLNSFCSDNSPLQFFYTAEYWFWAQDLIPPSMPVTMIATGRLLLGCFGIGEVEYAFNGTSWNQQRIFASMYNVPGGTFFGRYYTTSIPDQASGTFVWEFQNPNGWSVAAKPAWTGVKVDNNSLPWLLFDVTSSTNKSLLGSVTQVQMVSTRGGLFPDFTQAASSKIWTSSFSAVYWFYTDS
ncbi:hypothetical protein O6H91_05G021200 [Diphasiastrum complanatum]|uniref:Uncharacterized protein n=1 Tax=Diphasiastrum complanatum TaxID=34168 RepID=A0ACC2DL95_DIPCM|nr:hypothetical protein O6H91_05G021200 [Diphasiastrum complanatum]